MRFQQDQKPQYVNELRVLWNEWDPIGVCARNSADQLTNTTRISDGLCSCWKLSLSNK